jgi:NDP-sugar pyrophosphorylase family protein
MNQKPRKAILLAAGFGTRIQPLSYDLPKPMMPIWGKPAILRMIHLLRRFGVTEVLVNIHHNPGPIFDFFQTRTVKGMKLELSFEPEILGTGGALRKASWFFDEEPFWIANSDIVANVSPVPFLKEFDQTRPMAVLWLHPTEGPRTVEMENNKITIFRSSRPGTRGTYTFCGLQLVSPAILDFLPPAGFSSVIDAYSAAIAHGKRISGITVKGSFWRDIGSLEQYVEVHRALAARRRSGSKPRHSGTRIRGFASVGDGVLVEPGARISDSVIWDGAHIGRDADLRGAVIARDTNVNGPVNGAAIRCDKIKDAVLTAALSRFHWPADQVTAMPLAKRGSARSFTRLAMAGKTVICIHYSTEREENIHYAAIARFLRKKGLPVPHILLDMPDRHAVIVEDLGDLSLESAASFLSPQQLERVYRRILDALLELHAIPPDSAKRQHVTLQPGFARDLYRWERNLMAEHLLRKKLCLTNSKVGAIMKDLGTAANRLLEEPVVLVHRDMQSSNLLLKDGRPYFIDFQGMRTGPAAYDLASLLCDPYVMLSPELQQRLLHYYCSRSHNGRRIRKSFWYAAIERLAQALGAYGRLSALPGMGRFADYIPPAMRMMHRAITHTGDFKSLSLLVDSV